MDKHTLCRLGGGIIIYLNSHLGITDESLKSFLGYPNSSIFLGPRFKEGSFNLGFGLPPAAGGSHFRGFARGFTKKGGLERLGFLGPRI